MKSIIAKDEAIELINSGVTVKFDMEGGYAEVRKKTIGLYELSAYTHGEEKPERLNGSFARMMTFINRAQELYTEEESP